MNWFRWFPKVDYDGRQSVDFTSSIKIAKDVINRYEAYYPYVLTDGEQPWHIAVNYYGGVEFTWLVMLANDIIDPVLDWHMDPKLFESHIKEKYGSRIKAMEKILWYEKVLTDNEGNRLEGTQVKVSPDTYDAEKDAPGRWEYLQTTQFAREIGKEFGTSAYDVDHAANDDKRTVRLLEDIHASQAQRELRRLLRKEA